MATKNQQFCVQSIVFGGTTDQKSTRVVVFLMIKIKNNIKRAMEDENLFNGRMVDDVFSIAQIDGDNKENVNPTSLSQPMPRTEYVAGMSRSLSISTLDRDRGILTLQRHNEFCRLRQRITRLARYMEDTPQPGPLVIQGDHRYYYGDDYDCTDLEDWLHEMGHSYCAPMTHEECLRMRTARRNMMKTMLRGIPGVSMYAYPSLWYVFETMGQLLDSFSAWSQPLVGQMASVNDFFNNPEWLPDV